MKGRFSVSLTAQADLIYVISWYPIEVKVSEGMTCLRPVISSLQEKAPYKPLTDYESRLCILNPQNLVCILHNYITNTYIIAITTTKSQISLIPLS